MHEAMESIYHSVPIVALPVFIDLKVILYLVMLLHPHPSSCLTKVGLRIMHSTYHFFLWLEYLMEFGIAFCTFVMAN